jgi:hypothetical protein
VTSAGEPIYRNTFHLREFYVRENVHFLDGLVLDDGGAAPRGAGAVSTLHAP